VPSLDEPIARARAFVFGEQDPEGRWHDAEFPVDEGSDWVTAYVAKTLWVLTAASPGDAALERAIEAAHQALVGRQRHNGGWAYSDRTPTDAESTAWALWSLLDEPRLRLFFTGRGRRYLRAHWDADSGGFVPYVAAAGVTSDANDALSPPAGLRTPQPCITAVALRVLAIKDAADPILPAACDYLKRTQNADGLWRSDLWAVAGCPTLTALGALYVAGALDTAVLSAARDGLAMLMKDAHGYELASALITAPRLGLADVEEALDRLLAEQGPEGGWTPPSPIRTRISAAATIAAPEAAAPLDPGRSRPGELLTTVTALGALYLQH
jgi:hypothetical protein